MTTPTSSATASASVAFPVGTLAVVFLIVAKVQDLWGLGDLSWWWVFAPYWLPFLVLLVVLVIGGVLFGIGAGIVALIDNHNSKKRAKARAERLKR